MSPPAAPDDGGLEARIAALLRPAMSSATRLLVSRATPMFGGNARRAWSFDATWLEDDEPVVLPCILLSQVPGRHVETEIGQEYRVLRALTGRGLRTPAAIALDEEGTVTGAPALVLERIGGTADAVTFLNPALPETSRHLTRDLAEIAAGLHCFDWAGAGLGGETLSPFAEIDALERQFHQHRLEPHPALASLFGWLREHLPRPARLSLVHGDLRPGNFLYEGDRITALLDWEMAHLGDPAEDIAWVYRALWSPARFMPIEEFLAVHRARGGIDVPAASVAYYRIFSEVKFACISLAAAHSFATGKTRNLRHADRASKIPAALRQCFEWIDRGDWVAGHAA